MALSITARIVSSVVILDMSGRLCCLDVALQDSITELLEKGHREVVLNLADVFCIDGFGLGQLITAWTSIRERGGQLILLRPTDQVQKLLQITKLSSIFHITDDEARALISARVSLAASA